MATLTISRLFKRFGSVEVLKGIDLEAQTGEFVVLVGPSGCGKSTLLAMIAGLESVSQGEIRIDGTLVNAVAPKDRDIAMVFQSYALYPTMTARQNMTFGMESRRVPKPEMDAAIKRVSALLQIEPLLNRKPGQLSGGQRQRVAMGRALVRDPKLFLFDEPLSNLDAKLRVQMRAEIKELHQRLKTTTVYVTHDQIEAMTMADRIVVLRDGVVEQIGAPLELYDRPANLFVAGFIGSPAMNFLKGTIRLGDKPSFMIDGGVSLPLASAPAGSDGRPAVYGIRPEHLTLGGPNGVPAEVSVLEPTGLETQVFAKLGDQKIVAVFRQRMTASPGETLPMTPDATSAHLFDEKTGARLS